MGSTPRLNGSLLLSLDIWAPLPERLLNALKHVFERGNVPAGVDAVFDRVAHVSHFVCELLLVRRVEAALGGDVALACPAILSATDRTE